MKAMHADEHQLVEAARRGDVHAAATLVERFYERIYAFLRRLAGSDATAADLTQITFTRVWTALPGFAGRSSPGAWLHGIAYHVYLDWRRRDGRLEWRPDTWWLAHADTAPPPDRLAAQADLAAALYAAVDQLDPDLRDTVHTHYYQGLTLEETAAALDVAPSTVKHRLRRAVQALQARLLSPIDQPLAAATRLSQ